MIEFKKKPEMTNVFLALEKKQWQSVKAIAAANEISASELVRLIIADFLEKTEKGEKK